MQVQYRVRGLHLLFFSLLPIFHFAFVLFRKAATLDAPLFDHEAWTVGRFVELWWLWTSLPFAGGLLTLAAMRDEGKTETISIIFFVFLLIFCMRIGYAAWSEW